jgi:adenine deaminase
MDFLVRRAIQLGAPVASAYRAASWSAAQGFGLRDRGLVAPGYLADLLLRRSGNLRRRDGDPAGARRDGGELLHSRPADTASTQHHSSRTSDGGGVRGAGQRVGNTDHWDRSRKDHHQSGIRGVAVSRGPAARRSIPRSSQDLRLGAAWPERECRRGFVHGFGLRAGALASSVGHDSHNLCVVGADDFDMAVAANRVAALGGGFVAVRGGMVLAEMALPVAGLMSLRSFQDVAQDLERLRAATGIPGAPGNSTSENHGHGTGGCGPL